MSELNDKVKKAIERLKLFEPDNGYWVGYSGGKDSDCIRILADLANVKHENHYSHTSVDAPETVRYIRSLPDVIDDIPRDKDGRQITMWSIIAKHTMPPTRVVRYCCSDLKESQGKGQIVVTGVRWAESVNRKKNQGLVTIADKLKNKFKVAENEGADYKETRQGGIILNTENDASRRTVEQCFRTNKVLVNPIIDWTDEEVWEFLHANGCEGNPLYKCGHKRIGCIGCPMSGPRQMKADFQTYPQYRAAYVRAFDKMLENHKDSIKNLSWRNGEDVIRWWVDDDPNQITVEDYLKTLGGET